jgi:hypothetical protein
MKWNIPPLKTLKNTQQNIKTTSPEQEESNRVLFLKHARHLAVRALLTTLTSAQLVKGRNIQEQRAQLTDEQ